MEGPILKLCSTAALSSWVVMFRGRSKLCQLYRWRLRSRLQRHKAHLHGEQDRRKPAEDPQELDGVQGRIRSPPPPTLRVNKVYSHQSPTLSLRAHPSITQHPLLTADEIRHLPSPLSPNQRQSTSNLKRIESSARTSKTTSNPRTF